LAAEECQCSFDSSKLVAFALVKKPTFCPWVSVGHMGVV